MELARNTLQAAGVVLSCESPLPQLHAAEETVLCLAVREAVTNIVRHAQATHCRMRFTATSRRLPLASHHRRRPPPKAAGGQRSPRHARARPIARRPPLHHHRSRRHSSHRASANNSAPAESTLCDPMSAPAPSIRVVLAEDQTMVLGALSALLELEPDISVVAHTANGRDALTRRQPSHPRRPRHRHRDAAA